MAVLLLLPVAATVWKLYQLSRAPKDAALRSVTLSLVCACASYPLAMPGGTLGVDTVVSDVAEKIGQNVLLLATVYFLLCFYLYAAADRAGRRRARWEGVRVLLVITATIVLGESVPHKVFVGSFITADMTCTPLAAFYTVAGLYLLYALAVAAWWTRQYARKSVPPHSTGLWMAAAGMTGMAAACAVRAVFVFIRWQGGSVPQPLMVTVAFLLVASVTTFAIGITYPGARARVAAIRLWMRHRRLHRQLEPLWRLLSVAYPETVLHPEPPSRWDAWRVRGVHRRYHRRVVECRDCLVRISPYLGEEQHLDTTALAKRLREATETVLAERLDAASTVGKDAPAPRPAAALAMPQQDGRDADVQQLVELSEALRSAETRVPRTPRVTAGA